MSNAQMMNSSARITLVMQRRGSMKRATAQNLHPIMTGEQYEYLQAHASLLNSSDRQALGGAIITGVSPAHTPLGKIPEPDHTQSHWHSLSDDSGPDL